MLDKIKNILYDRRSFQKRIRGREMQIQAIQFETFGGNAAATAAKKGYSILVGGEKFIVGTGNESAAKSKPAEAVINTFKKLTSQTPGNKLNVLA